MSSIPKSRDDLLELIESRYSKLWLLIENLTEAEGAIMVDDDFAIKDLIALRWWWAEQVILWIKAGQKGRTPITPAEGYTWRETPALNKSLAKTYDSLSLDETRRKLRSSKTKVVKIIHSLSDEELEQQGVYEWAGKWPLMRWISVGTSSQYDGATRQIRKALKAAH